MVSVVARKLFPRVKQQDLECGNLNRKMQNGKASNNLG